VVTSPAGAFAKYYDEYVCLCVCLSARISPELHARSLLNFSCMLPMAMARSSSDRVMNSQGEGAVLGVFFPLKHSHPYCCYCYSIASHGAGVTPFLLFFTLIHSFPHHLLFFALCSIAFETHTKTADWSRCRLGWWLGLAWGTVNAQDPKKHNPQRKMAIGGTCPTSLTALWLANWTGPCSSMYMIGAVAWLQVLDKSIVGCRGVGGGIAHLGPSLISTIALLMLW